MIGIDTNVLVRFLVRDDEAQFQKARKLIARETSAGRQVFVGLLVLLETEWVLRSRYNLGKDEIVAFVAGLLDSADVQIEDEPAVEEALFVWKDHATGFADCLNRLRCFGFRDRGLELLLRVRGHGPGASQNCAVGRH